ncbi:MAG: hypothetical protein IJ839_04720 [Ruminobacter sp.]|nr:hypothetical protein [Ruminobacter sp.]
MQGIIIKLPQKSSIGIILGYDFNRYVFSIDDVDPRLKPAISDEVDFTPYSGNRNRICHPLHKSAHINSIVHYVFPEDSNNIKLSPLYSPKKLKIIFSSKSYLIRGEGASREQALEAMTTLARKSGFTAVTDLTIQTKYRRYLNDIIYVFEGIPAIDSSLIQTVDLKAVDLKNHNTTAESINKDNAETAGNTADNSATPDIPQHEGRSFLMEKARPIVRTIKINDMEHRVFLHPADIKKISPNTVKKYVLRMIMFVIMLLLLPLWMKTIFSSEDLVYAYISLVAGIFIETVLAIISYYIFPHSNCSYFIRRTFVPPVFFL